MAGIIKSDRWSDAPTTLRSSTFNFEDMTIRANNYLAQVQQQAAQLVVAATAEADQIAEQAKQRGYQQALQQAQQSLGETLDEQLQTLVPALQAAVDDICHSRADWLRHWEQQTVSLAASMAKHVIRRELQQTPKICLDLIREALELAMGSGSITVHLHPADYEALRDKAAAIAEQMQAVGTADVVSDDQVTAGGCRVVTAYGTIDQTIEAQLERIVEELT